MSKTAKELLREITDDFNSRYDNDEQIKRILKILSLGKGTYKEAHQYSKRVGEILAGVFQDNISSEVLPDGRMYYNFAKAVVGERLENNYRLVVDVSKQAQTNLNRNAGIMLNPVTPELNKSRIQGILNRLDREPEFDKVKWILDAPVTNYTQSVVDDCIYANAGFQMNVGFTPKIRRIAVGKACPWCQALEGVWEYSEVKNTGNPVFQRHQNCDCLILYDPADGKSHYKDTTSKRDYSREEVRDEVRKRLDAQTKKNYNQSPANIMREAYNSSVQRGMISPLVGFENYYTHYTAIYNAVVGKTTVAQIEVAGVNQHLMERFFGVLKDPKTGKERKGVSISDIVDALFSGKVEPEKPRFSLQDGKPMLNPDGSIQTSISHIGGKCKVSVNPVTRELIQCQPISSRKKK